MSVLEASIVKATLRVLAVMGVVARRNVVEPALYSHGSTGLGEGSADIVGVDSRQNGRAVFLEAKRSAKKSVHNTSRARSGKQQRFRDEMARAGAVVGQFSTPEEAVEIVTRSRQRGGHVAA